MSTLEQRIAAALTDGNVKSADIEALIVEVEAAAASAEEAVTKARAHALDPLVVDAAARTALADGEHIRDRLAVALPRLRDRLAQR
jgi:hypothetical protein